MSTRVNAIRPNTISLTKDQQTLFDALTEVFKDAFPDVNIELIETTKNNGQPRSGVSLENAKYNLAPVFWFDMLDEMQKEMPIGNVIMYIAQHYEKMEEYSKKCPEITHDFAAKELFAHIINFEKNAELVNNSPHKKMGEFAIVTRISAQDFGSLHVTDEVCELCDMTPAEVLKQAVKNSKEHGYQILDLEEYAGEDNKGENKGIVYAVTNDIKNFGAIVPYIFPEVLSELREKFGGDYYMLPSSIHEWIAVSSRGQEQGGLRDLLQEINRTMLDSRDFLSDNVYIVDESLKMKMVK
ncbi:MAG: hypothetical protein KBS79_03230 [Lachnospiraceae bacterium]|nr:hypothetical protein [Candidatus Minthocola equi]